MRMIQHGQRKIRRSIVVFVGVCGADSRASDGSTTLEEKEPDLLLNVAVGDLPQQPPHDGFISASAGLKIVTREDAAWRVTSC